MAVFDIALCTDLRIFSGILEESPTKEDNFATTKAKYFYQSCMNMCK